MIINPMEKKIGCRGESGRRGWLKGACGIRIILAATLSKTSNLRKKLVSFVKFYLLNHEKNLKKIKKKLNFFIIFFEGRWRTKLSAI